MCTWQPLISRRHLRRRGSRAHPDRLRRDAARRPRRVRPAEGPRRRDRRAARGRRARHHPHRHSDFYGPHVTNEIIREALAPYPDDLHIVTKVGARRDAAGRLAARPDARGAAASRCTTTCATSGSTCSTSSTCASAASTAPSRGSIAEPFAALAELQQQGLIRHLGVSTVTAEQIAEAQSIAPVVCVQNLYNLARRDDDALIDSLAAQGIAYVPYFPLGGFTPLQSDDAGGGRRPGSTRRRCRSRWPGCCSARRTSC